MIKTVKEIATFSFEEKKSKFIGFVYPTFCEKKAKEILKDIKQQFSDCRHIVWAYKINGIERKNNDGEPTGAVPILNSILYNELDCVLVVVVRYFGGILLGAGGLFRAYGFCVNEAIKRAVIRNLEEYLIITCKCSYAQIQYVLSNYNVIASNYLDLIELTIAIKEEQFSEIKNYVSEIEVLERKLM